MTTINLPKFIAEHYKGGISARDVVREALTNAIHAGATNITVKLGFALKQQSFLEEDRSYLQGIEVIDDGEGFTDSNLAYFDEILTSHKDSIGGKGVGRLAYLKYANTVKIASQLSTELVKFPYTETFSLMDVERVKSLGAPKTAVSISNPKEEVYTQVAKLINSICDDLRLLMFLKKKRGQNIIVTFTHDSTQSFPPKYVFNSQDIEPLLEDDFQIDSAEFSSYLFEDRSRKGISAMLCADEICVEEVVVSKRFDVCRYVVSITSPYLDKLANLERQRIEIPEHKDTDDLISPITRERLIKLVRDKSIEMINSVGEGEIEGFRHQNVEKLKVYYPFIDINTFNGNASFLDADDVVKAYRAQQARREDKIVEDLVKGKTVSWDDVSHLASDDLARYIVHRALLIDSLSKLPAGSAEEAIHAAILPKGSDGSDIRTNNVWIVDDKFLAYSSIYSDQKLRTIIERVNVGAESKLGKKPDVAAFYATDDEDRPNKLVVIEFKKPGTDVFDNNKALTQCRLYASDLSEAISTVREVFSFAIVDIDAEFKRDLRQQEFMPVFSLSEPVFYKKYSLGEDNEIPLHLYVMPASALLKDAKARNRIFEEVLQFKTG